MKKHLKIVLLTSVVGLFFLQDSKSSELSNFNDEKVKKVQEKVSTLTISPMQEDNFPFKGISLIDEKDVVRYKPKDENELNLKDVVNLVHSSIFSYDKGGKYLGLLKDVKFDGQFSKSCVSYVCNELGCYYTREGKKDLARTAFSLENKYNR